LRDGDAGTAPAEVIWLSHPLAEDTPVYGGGAGLQIESTTAISRGDTANTGRVCMPNHIGTHVDFPAHFFDGAPTLSDYAPVDWLFRRPVLIDVSVPSGGLVSVDDIAGGIVQGADLVLLRTGHGETRGTDEYWQGGPGVDAELGLWIRHTLPSVRAVGMDLISVTSRLNREAGREAHRAFLDPGGTGAPVLLVEDMKLDCCPRHPGWVVVSPLAVKGADGVPVTVWAMGGGEMQMDSGQDTRGCPGSDGAGKGPNATTG
jgi:arylformamidase